MVGKKLANYEILDSLGAGVVQDIGTEATSTMSGDIDGASISQKRDLV